MGGERAQAAHGRCLHARRRFLGAALVAPALPLLAACGWFAKPVSRPPVPTPTRALDPTVTPTPAPVPVRVETPPPTRSPTATPATTVAPAPSTEARAPGGGQLLYAGSLGGVRGLILANLDVGTRRLVTAGAYAWPTWSPDGARFAALGVAAPEVPTQQLAVFAADGRALARYPIPLAQPLGAAPEWSPDGRTLLYRFGDAAGGRVATWLVDDDGQRTLDPGLGAEFWRWAPDGRLAGQVVEGGGGPRGPATPVALWTVDATGGDPRRAGAGPFTVCGWSPDGAIVYALGGLRAIPVRGGQQWLSPTTLLAIARWDAPPRTLLDVGAPDGDGPARALIAVPAPHGDRLAVLVSPALSDPAPAALAATSDLLIVDRDGGTVGRDAPWDAGYFPRWLAWSPDGRQVAYDAPGPGGTELRVFTVATGARLAYPFRIAGSPEPRAAWSPDGRWLAYVDAVDGLLRGAAAEERTYPLAADGDFPAWRPGR